MTVAPSEETKPVFTPEQRQVLGRVYSYLMDIARKRARQQEPVDHLQACHQEEKAGSEPTKSSDLST
jgi:hypothetical protein